MLILTIRTDKPEAEIGLYDGEKELAYETWQAHRKLAETLHYQIAKILQFDSKNWGDIKGIVCFKGPGSFTGLRIGLSVSNSLAYSLSVPIIGTTGERWIQSGINILLSGKSHFPLQPKYGEPAYTTKPKK